jgi:two-component system sensor histidine kinase BaeS
MRRRLTVTMIVMVAAALVVAGLLTLVLAIRSARQDTRSALLSQARSLAGAVEPEAVSVNPRDPAQSLRTILRLLKSPLKLQQAAVIAIGPGGRLLDVANPAQPVTLPNGLTVNDIKPATLLAGKPVVGTKGPIVFAAAPFKANVQFSRADGRPPLVLNLTQAVILTRRPPTGLHDAGIWFVLAGAVTLAVAALVATRLGRRITRPLEAAEATTRRVAAGDLSARVPSTAGADPETASLARSINSMAESLARSRGLERQLLMSVSHDLRTPLTSIRGFAEAIADGAAPDTHRAAEVIASESRRLERLVGDLLELAKLDAHQFSLDLKQVDLSEVVVDTGDGFRPAADELGIHLSIDTGVAGTVPATADPDRVAQVVANLVENALKYARAEVHLGTAVSGGLPVLWVEDDGPGIAIDDLPRVFERLFTSTRRPARPVGSGLGLAIVAELVDAMGGSVRAESPVFDDGGTRLVVTLPGWS